MTAGSGRFPLRMRRQLFPLPVAVLVTALAFFVNEALTDSDAVVPASAPATAFSGERAMQLLEAFLADGEAHPVGSAANGAVRERIRAWLDEQGIEHVEQQSWGCSTRDPGCAYTRNIVATVPGRADGPFVALMAHYDSTPFSPGAGDDMAGVVSILETARAVMAGPAPALPLLLLITDAEETRTRQNSPWRSASLTRCSSECPTTRISPCREGRA